MSRRRILGAVRRPALIPLACLLSVACGSSKPEQPARSPESESPKAAAEPPKSEASAPAAQVAKIPTECESKDADFCAVPKEFVGRLCDAVRLNVALSMFQKGTPWQRGYLTRKTSAWNAEGGATEEGFLEFDEEVLLLKSKAPPKGGMQVSGMGGYQALRWDGSCVTLQSEEVTTRRAPSPKHPRIDIRYLDDGIRDALRKNQELDAAFSARRKECKGIAVGDVSKKCVELDQKLGDAIVKYVSENSDLPDPAKIP